MVTYSVLDLVSVRTGQTSAEAVASSMALAALADELGFERYWFAEHHNMPAVASTSPAVLIAAAAARTQRIRVGSGGVMLPNHAPLIVAEQFATLEAMAPGRIDLGIGRAPGSDPVVTHLLRQSGATSDVDRFPQHVADIAAIMSAEGATMRFTTGGEYAVHATPHATSTPHIWLLGSSDYSAMLAAQFGLPYVFANHFSGQGLERALDLYRSQFQPSATLEAPRTFLTTNVVASPTLEEAEQRALPQMRIFTKLRLNQPLTPLETVEESQAALATVTAQEQELIAGVRRNWVVGTGESVRAELTSFAAQHGVDEIMVVPVAGAYANEDRASSFGREQTLRLIANA
ncbi:LLM class flavin-dependent oxidoreductase [Microbacterium mitrae]|uniref:LLM class flavin-dependent oxidoreductase n=1 Tax=Microbacterium mitrae TaxID=664640 RepID=A0A5C8HR42_9MICO|nr:LLM class flavin-dependent oxidoreductase [Microbacterium mitrae]TXK06484.1 LLM class flavin-dependent oxidoreductase [Microbacterium mitrae]